MSGTVLLARLGAYALDEIELGIAGASAAAPAGEPKALARTAEIRLAFATADGSPGRVLVLPADGPPLPPAEIRALLVPLGAAAVVASAAGVKKAAPAARGALVLRVLLCS